jgi:hypothetical protein
LKILLSCRMKFFEGSINESMAVNCFAAQTECFDFSELSDFPDNWIYGYAIPVPIQTIRSC